LPPSLGPSTTGEGQLFPERRITVKEYTGKVHARRLLKMLEKKDPCMCCPAQPYYKSGMTHESLPKLPEIWKGRPCLVCVEFVGLLSPFFCPCQSANTKADVLKWSWIALEEKGYLE